MRDRKEENRGPKSEDQHGKDTRQHVEHVAKSWRHRRALLDDCEKAAPVSPPIASATMTPEPDQPLNLVQALVSLLVPSLANQNGIPEAGCSGGSALDAWVKRAALSLTSRCEARRAVGCAAEPSAWGSVPSGAFSLSAA